MATQQDKLLFLAGAGALLLVSSGKKKRRAPKANPAPVETDEDLDEGEVIFEAEDDDPTPPHPKDPEPEINDYEAILNRFIGPNGRAHLGSLYQIKKGDTPLEICREALFGSRAPVVNPAARQAVMDLLIRIDCGPWNQALYGRELNILTPGHAQIDSHWTQRGVSFDPIYHNNLERMMDGLAPSGAPDSYFAFIWIPMINLDKFDMEGIVTTEGMHHPDTTEGRGGSMIDPPREILKFGFDSITPDTFGCELPEGNFRKSVIAS